MLYQGLLSHWGRRLVLRGASRNIPISKIEGRAQRAFSVGQSIAAEIEVFLVGGIRQEVDLAQESRGPVQVLVGNINNLAISFGVIVPVRVAGCWQGTLISGTRHIPPYSDAQIMALVLDVKDSVCVQGNPLQGCRVIISIGFVETVLEIDPNSRDGGDDVEGEEESEDEVR